MASIVLTVVGARPQFVKSSVVSEEIRRDGRLTEFLVHTGQHYDREMSEVFFAGLQMDAPQRNLAVGSGTHAEQTAAMLVGLDAVMREVQPAIVLAYGDTNSTVAAALSATKLGIPLAHVEAGLRCNNLCMAEEINRRMTDSVSRLLFAPTHRAEARLLEEGVPREWVFFVGDVMYDAALRYGGAARGRRVTRAQRTESKRIVVTIHRAENTDNRDRLGIIADALNEVATRYDVLFPIHPRTRRRLDEFGIVIDPAVKATEPLGFREMSALVSSAAVVVTDSGGLQKEAFFHGIPCVTVRDETEWVELLQYGWNRLAPPTSAAVIVNAVRDATESEPSERPALYGNGDASARVVQELCTFVFGSPAEPRPPTAPGAGA
jgi:UDP-GlcNAc3NAcA epimerase